MPNRVRDGLPLVVVVLMLLSAVFICGCSESPSHVPQIKVIAFTAAYCEPCQAAKPTLQAIKGQGIEVTTVDFDARPDLAAQYGVRSVPAYFVYVEGRQVERTQDIGLVWRIVLRVIKRKYL